MKNFANKITTIVLLLFFFTLNTKAESPVEKSDSTLLNNMINELLFHIDLYGTDSIFYNKVKLGLKLFDRYEKKHGRDNFYLSNSAFLISKFSKFDIKKAKAMFDENIETARRKNYKKALALNIHDLGLLYKSLDLNAAALANFLESASLFYETKDLSAYAFNLIDIGNIYFNENSLKKAKEYFEKARKIFDNSITGQNKYTGFAILESNLALIDKVRGDTLSAVSHFHKALEFRNKAGVPANTSYTYLQMSQLYASNHNDDSDKYYFYLAIDNYKKNGLYSNMANALIDKGSYLIEQKKYDTALTILRQALSLSKQNNILSSAIAANYYTGLAKYELGETESALQYALMADSLTGTYLNYELKPLIFKLLSNIYEKKADYSKAYSFLNKYIEWNEDNSGKTLLNRKLAQQVNEKLKSEQQRNFEQQKSRYIIIFLSLIILISLTFIFFLIRLERKIKNQNENLKSVMESRDKIYSIISHDLKGPIGSAQTILDILVKEPLDEKTKDELILSVQKSNAATYDLLINLLYWANLQRGKIKFQSAPINLDQMCNENIKLYRESSNTKNISLINNIEEGLVINSDENMLKTIIRNLINNAVKFTPEGGKVEITAVKQNGNVNITVSDSGPGMSKEQIEAILHSKETINIKKSGNIHSAGLGLQIIKSFVKEMKGSIHIDSKPGQGTSITISLPEL